MDRYLDILTLSKYLKSLSISQYISIAYIYINIFITYRHITLLIYLCVLYIHIHISLDILTSVNILSLTMCHNRTHFGWATLQASDCVSFPPCSCPWHIQSILSLWDYDEYIYVTLWTSIIFFVTLCICVYIYIYVFSLYICLSLSLLCLCLCTFLCPCHRYRSPWWPWRGVNPQITLPLSLWQCLYTFLCPHHDCHRPSRPCWDLIYLSLSICLAMYRSFYSLFVSIYIDIIYTYMCVCV